MGSVDVTEWPGTLYNENMHSLWRRRIGQPHVRSAHGHESSHSPDDGQDISFLILTISGLAYAVFAYQQ